MNNFNNGFNNPNMGYGYAGTSPEPIAMNTPLKPEDIEYLRHNETPVFGKKLTKDEYLRAICTHKDKNGNFTLKDNHDGTFTCSICKTTFRLIDPIDSNPEQIESICENFKDLFESIKTMYGPISVETAQTLYSIAGFIPKIPKMYEIASRYYNKLDPGKYAKQYYNNGTSNQLWSLLNGGFGGGFGQFPQQPNPWTQQQAQQGYYNQGMQAPQAPAYTPQPNYGTQPNMGPQAPQGYYPGNPNPAYGPQSTPNPMGYQDQSNQVPVNTAPAAPQTVKQTQTATSPDVNASFKG